MKTYGERQRLSVLLTSEEAARCNTELWRIRRKTFLLTKLVMITLLSITYDDIHLQTPEEKYRLIQFFKKVRLTKSKDDCWLWTAALSSTGYGVFNGVSAARWIYQQWFGELDRKTEVDHLCNTRRCVNPYHLEAVSKWVNRFRATIRRYENYG